MTADHASRRGIGVTGGRQNAEAPRVGLPKRLAWCLLVLLMVAAFAAPAVAQPATPAGSAEVPLQVGSRTVFVFRAPLGAMAPQERAQAAQQHLARAFERPGAGWTSVRRSEHGALVELDGQPMFLVLAADAPRGTELDVDTLANAASRQLQQAWSEAQERRDPQARSSALLKAAAALAALLVVLGLLWLGLGRLRAILAARQLRALSPMPVPASPDSPTPAHGTTLAARIAPLLLGLASQLALLLTWLASLAAVSVFLAYALTQFAHTRALGEGLLRASSELALQSLGSAAAALPGLFVAALIFLVAWVATQLSTQVFQHLASGQLRLGLLDAHTAPATRYIVNAALWLFALAMAYPYLPGAQTEAFKGLSVIVGLMVSLGASSLVGQMASGLILVYTRALMRGEYVRILDHEGTVTEVGLVLTRLRNGMGAEIALPNALVLGNVTRNYSRTSANGGFVLEVKVSIGYDTPWRQVHAMLLNAALAVPEVVAQPAPRVFQVALDDAYVIYTLVVTVQSKTPAARAHATSALNASIQDEFNRHGVQIMSPHYFADPAQPKVVPESQWYTAPAKTDPPRPEVRP